MDGLVAPWDVFDLDNDGLQRLHDTILELQASGAAPPSVEELRKVVREEMDARSGSFVFLTKLAASASTAPTSAAAPEPGTPAPLPRQRVQDGDGESALPQSRSPAAEKSVAPDLPPPPPWYRPPQPSIPDGVGEKPKPDSAASQQETQVQPATVQQTARRGLWDSSGSSSTSSDESEREAARRQRASYRQLFAADGYFTRAAAQKRRRPRRRRGSKAAGASAVESASAVPARKPPIPQFDKRPSAVARPVASTPTPGMLRSGVAAPLAAGKRGASGAAAAITTAARGHAAPASLRPVARSATPTASMSSATMKAPAAKDAPPPPAPPLQAAESFVATADATTELETAPLHHQQQRPETSQPVSPTSSSVEENVVVDAEATPLPNEERNTSALPQPPVASIPVLREVEETLDSLLAPNVATTPDYGANLLREEGLSGVGSDDYADVGHESAVQSEQVKNERPCTPQQIEEAAAAGAATGAARGPLPVLPLVDYSAHFNAIEDFLIEPTRLVSLRRQPAPVIRQALEKLRTSLLEWFALMADFEREESGESGTSARPSQLLTSFGNDAMWYRVQASRAEVYELVTGVMDDRCDPRWEEAGDEAELWNVWWSWRKPKPKEAIWLAPQLVNHIPSSSQLTRKDLLKANVQRYASKSSPAAAQFRVVPPTFTLPAEYVPFAAAFAETRGLWIMKTVGMSRGRGIKIVSKIEDVTYTDTVVVQQYIDRPCLIEGFKFDFRLYCVVTQFSPLECFLSHRGFARISSSAYTTDPSSLDNKSVHLTNTSISNEAKRASQGNVQRTDTKWHLDKVKDYFEKRASKKISGTSGGKGAVAGAAPSSTSKSGADATTSPPPSWDVVWQRICAAIVRVLACAEDNIKATPCTFELFGFDVLLDADMRPYILEVNASPAMDVDGPVDEAVKPALFHDIFDMLDPLPIDRVQLLRVVEELLESSESGKYASPSERQRQLNRQLTAVLRGRVPRRYGEMPQKLGAFERLAPSPLYEKIVKQKRSV